MKYFLFLVSTITLLILGGCRNDFDDVVINNEQLRFSTDTIHLDTLFTKVRSSTKRFSIINTSDDDIVIPKIALGRGVNSFYTLNINGLPGADAPNIPSSGKIFENIEVLAKDSIFGFVQTTLDYDLVKNDLNDKGEYNDQIIFQSPNGNQSVELFTKINDADFIFNDIDAANARPIREIETKRRNNKGELIKLKAYELTDTELTVNNSKALLIAGYAIVPSGKTMRINAGSRIHFMEIEQGETNLNEKAGLIIEDGARLEILGAISTDLETPEKDLVIIEGSRIDEDFDILPGQWDFIWIQKGATASISNCIIKNAITPLFVEGNGNISTPPNNQLTLNNVQIYNAQTAGIQATATSIDAFNVVIDQCGNNSLNIEEGGIYNFSHSTIANYFNLGISGVAVGLNNTKRAESDIESSNLNISFTNCIIDGPSASEIRLTNSNQADFTLFFENCLIKTRNNSFEPLLDISNNSIYSNCIFNEDPKFRNTNLNQLFIDNESAANGKAKIIGNGNDILGKSRNTTAPDIGAYESISFEELDKEKK